jgi:histidine ammonia-lyase
MIRLFGWGLLGMVAVSGAQLGAHAAAADHAAGAHAAGLAYHFITPSQVAQTVVLTGHDLTVEQVVEVARFGAKVALSPEARQRADY